MEILFHNFGNSFEYHNGRIEISRNSEGFVTINKTEYLVKSFNHKGNNSKLFELCEAQFQSNYPDKVLKICRYNIPKREELYKPIHKRFIREIEALIMCKENFLNDVIRIYDYGKIKIGKCRFLFYTMQYAENDLRKHLELNNLTASDRIGICIELCDALNKLHNIDIYHRDIKPDNILLTSDGWKIGDLGLVAYRNEDVIIDRNGEFIGPRGWVNPEAMNKYLTEGVDHYLYDCMIDNQSDIFQMGKLFWFLLQGNGPIGCVKFADFKFVNHDVYPILRTMLNHSKKKRPKDLSNIMSDLQKIHKKIVKM